MGFIGKSKSFKVFIWLAVGAIGTAMSIFFRNQIIYAQYDEPPELLFYPLLFEYAAFAVVAFLFPWSWKLARGNKILRVLSVGLSCLLFVLLYVFILSFIEWYAYGQRYDFWSGYRFMVLHSSLLSIVVYACIALILFALGIPENSKDPLAFTARIPYRSRNETHYLPVEKVLFFESDGNYISAYTDTMERVLIRKPLHRLEKELDPEIFQRIHRRHMVHLGKIASYKANPNGGYSLSLLGKKQLRVSKSFAPKLRPLLKDPS
ncbi:LytTR family DNA-binding domain-containing protein [Flavobacteriaceae bacterium 3-367]